MGPGPSDVSPRVLTAQARQTIGHLDPQFVDLMDEIKALLRYAFRTENDVTFPVSAPGSAGMETCVVNIVEPGDKVIVCINGVFGGRMKENIERAGGVPIAVEDDWGKPVSVSKLEDVLRENPDAVAVGFVHSETSTGVRSDAETLCSLAREHACLTIVDAVTTLGGIPLEVDAWGIDAIYSGSQKCLSAPPGLSPVSFSEKALDKIRNRKTKVQSWFLDLNLVLGYWDGDGGRAYHHTAPVNAMYGLHESLVILHEEGLEASWERHQRLHQQLHQGLGKLGIEYLVEPPYRLPQLNSVLIPDHLQSSEADIRKKLLNDHQLEIGAGLGALAGKVWRIGLMGHGASEANVSKCLEALETVMAQ
ncbi:alanine--glyoxylate aminotransferase family protein [Parvularcula sp. IMCC14364]|uniref:pyridoxal-phosphate-dependent aminotransferase family protein n=1 Tax=Parvularcula sp. IMCC14364 TaxID=3067902 RepID=UPI0035577463